MKKDKILKALTGSGIPGEVLLDVPYITMSGNFSCYIENHIGIISYDDGCIKINTKNAIIKINGEDLCLSGITDEIISVTGKIRNVEFV